MKYAKMKHLRLLHEHHCKILSFAIAWVMALNLPQLYKQPLNGLHLAAFVSFTRFSAVNVPYTESLAEIVSLIGGIRQFRRYTLKLLAETCVQWRTRPVSRSGVTR